MTESINVRFKLPTIEKQRQMLETIAQDQAAAESQIITNTINKDDLTPSIYHTVKSGLFIQPTGDQVKFAVNEIMKRGYKKADLSKWLNVGIKKNRTILRWESGGDEESVIPYAAWRLICAWAGLVYDLELPENKQ